MPKQREKLGARQREALALFEQGLSTDEIAKKLKISANGVYQHKRRLVEAGLLEPDQPQRRKRNHKTTAAEALLGEPPRRHGEGPNHLARLRKDAKDGIAAIDNEVERLNAWIVELQERCEKLEIDRDRMQRIAETIDGDHDDE